MIVEVDAASPLPAYEQLRSQIAAMIGAGTLAVGDKLPPIRQLAADLDLAPGTVARAYRELETAGLVVAGGRRGTRVADRVDRAVVDADAHLARAARTYATAARQVGATDAAAVHALRKAFQA